MHLIAAFPVLAIYSYQSYRHFHCGQTREIIDAAETAGAPDRDFLKKLSDYS